MKYLGILILLCNVIAVNAEQKENYGQPTAVGIKWVENLSWEEIKAKAKSENKYIFVDCYATWCGPCKAMDSEVYPLEEVGKYYNSHFISVKAQMDTSKSDNESIRRWYADAHQLMVGFSINQLPTFLYFSPDGKVVHQAVGRVEPEGFITEGQNALDPEKQYYNLLNKYNDGTLGLAQAKELTKKAFRFGQKIKSKEVADFYIRKLSAEEMCLKENIEFVLYYAEDIPLYHKLAQGYISCLKSKEIFQKENIEFIKTSILSSKDYGFRLFYKNVKKIDSLMGVKGYAQGQLEFIMSKEEIDPYLKEAIRMKNEPAWRKLNSNICKKYNCYYADRIILSSKIRWFRYKKDWVQMTKAVVNFVQKSLSLIDNWNLNNYAWDIFEHSGKRDELEIAASWSELSIKMDPKYSNSYDTYANLLYKLGYSTEAMKWEQKAIDLDRQNVYIETLDKMKKGLPTWP